MTKPKTKKKAPVSQTMQEVLEQKNKELAEQLTDFKSKYLAALADSENMRKRLQKEKQEFMEFAKRDLLRDILLPIDQFETALRHAANMSDDVKNWAIGFQMILSQIEEILEQNKVTSFETKGKKFDPTLHEVIEIIETDDAEDNEILEQCAKGYMIGQSLLRPAKVKIAKNKVEEPSTNQDETIKEK